jgi:D-alanine-D-alanine ligase
VETVRVGVVMGGTSSERDISLRSGDAVAEALEALGHDVVRIVLGNGVDALEALGDADIDAAFLALHGRQGEDGCIQGVLELLGIPYTGSGVLASALAMDKLKSKELFRLHNVPTPPYYTVGRREVIAGSLGDGAISEELVKQAHGSFGFPVVVKPRREGSSVGVQKAMNLAELERAIDDALLYDDAVLVERYIAGKEVAVAILDGRVLGAIEVAAPSGLYDFQAKYESGLTEYHIPARLPEARIQGIMNLAERAAESLDVRGAVRVDLMVTEGMNEYVLEVNTIPGMTERSLLPRIAAHAGYDFGALCEAILASARLDSGMGLESLADADAFDRGQVWQEESFDQDDLAWVPAAAASSSAARARRAG